MSGLREWTAAQLAEQAKTITAPGYFIELGFSVPVRFCTRGETPWNSEVWLACNCALDGFGIDGTPVQEGTLEFVDANGEIGILCLAEGVADRRARVWMYSGDAPLADNDPKILFDGVMDTYDIDTASATVKLPLRKAQVLMAPRQIMNSANGFNHLAVAGTKFSWGGQDYVLQPASR